MALKSGKVKKFLNLKKPESYLLRKTVFKVLKIEILGVGKISW